MADNVAQQIKNLGSDIERLDMGLKDVAKSSKIMEDAIIASMRKGDASAKETIKSLRELQDVLLGKFGNGKDIKIAVGIEKDKLERDIADVKNKIERGIVTKNTGRGSIATYKEQLNQLGNLEKSFARIDQIVNTPLKKQQEAYRKILNIQQEIQRIRNRQSERGARGLVVDKATVDAEVALIKRLEAEIRVLKRERTALSKESGVSNSTKLSKGDYAQSLEYQRQLTKETVRHGEALERIKKQQREVKSGFEQMLPTIRRLAGAFGVAFSVQGLVQFGKKLVETRGEFEMQFVAMKQIIGDVDAATKIWNQTMQQALQSPFKAMQLVDYTKKLAAYRIETEKLFDTTKRLADVSAGLGVDMGRLILAYGQVKAANFLRASEIRQFTEAGVNIVGQLSDYFTQLEGRAVSTADVMERVTKRMVMFSDVEEIFKRMTDEGGEFYKMQEVQADTVKGQINKLHDAYDQMLNTIGQANQGTIRNFIESLNQMVRNWRDVASFIMKNVNAMVVLIPLIATYRKGAKSAAGETYTWSRAMKQIELDLAFASKGIKGFSLSTVAGTTAVYMFRGALELLKTAFRTFVPFLAIEGLILLITKMQSADRAAKQLTKDLDEVGKRNAQSLQDNIDGFTNLVERLKKATEGSQDYLDIRNKIQNQYGEYLDNLEAEQITVENLANSYDRVVERMREKSRQHIMEEGIQEIEKTYSDAYLKFTKALEGTKVGNIKLSSGEAEDIAKKMYDLYSKNPSRYDTNKLFLAALKQYGLSGEIDGTTFSERNEFFKSIEQRYKKQLELETKANSLTKATSDTRQEYLDQLAAQEEHEREIAKIESKTALSTEKKNYLIHAEDLRYQEKKLELLAKYGKKSDEWLDNEKAKLKDNLKAFLDSYNTRVEAYVGSVYGADWREKDNVAAFKDYNAMIATQSRIAQGQSRWEEAILNDKKTTEDNIKRLKEQQATQTARDAAATAQLNEELAKENHRLELIKKQMELLGLHEKDKSKGSYSNNGIYGDRIRLLQDMLQKFKQAAKEAYGYAKAEEKVAESFEDAWSTIMPSGYGELEVPTSYSALAEMLQRLEQFTPQFDKNGKLSKMMADLKKAISDALSQVDFEMSVRIREDFGRQMEEAFGNYELTLELQKLNIPDDVAKDLFPDFDAETLGDLQGRMRMFLKEQGKNFDEDDLKKYEEWSKKVDSEILKYRKDKAKQYSKYLEKEYSDRAKLQMQYAKDVAFVTANFKDEKQRDNIIKNIDKKFHDDLNELNWKSFKESDFYVEMMEDISSLPAEYTQMMLDKLNEILENPETLSPRALKEAINARQKVLDAQIATQPIKLMSTSVKEIRDAAKNLGGNGMLDTKKRVDEEIVSVQREINEYNELIVCLQNTQGEMKAYEDAVKSTEDAYGGLTLQTRRAIDMLGETHALGMFQHTMEENQKAIDEINEKEEEGGKLDSADRQRRAGLQAENDLLAAQIKLINDWIEAKRKEEEIRMRQVGTEAEYKRGQGETSSDVGEQITSTQEETDTRTKRVQELKQWQKAFLNFTKGWESWNRAVNDAINKVSSMGNAVYDMYDALGGETDALTEGWKEFGNTLTQTITSTLTLIPQLVAGFVAAGTSINAAMGIVGLIAEAVQLVVTMIGAFAKLHDAHYEKEIENQQKKIDALKDAYARLERQIEKTWDSVSYIQTYNQQVQNIREQIAATEAQLAAARQEKGADTTEGREKIRGYENDLVDLYDQLDEIKQKQIEVFGGVGDNVTSWTEGFVEAWKSAFIETGNGLDALQDHFDEFLQEWFVKQAVMAGASSLLKPVIDEINKAVDPNGEGNARVTYSELERVREVFGTQRELLDEFLTDMAGMYDLRGEGSLSGLAAGIQGMTEEQANILEAYWNSVRMYTASIDMNVARIAEMLGVGGANTNPLLQQMTLVAANTQATHQLLQSVVKSGHSQGGYGIKVFND